MKTALLGASLFLGFLAGAIAGIFSFLGLPTQVAAVLEEVLKAGAIMAALALSGKERLALRNCVACGLLAGIGFGAAELVSYFVVFYYHNLSLWLLRLPPLAMHAATGAILGYAAYAAGKKKWLPAAAIFAAAAAVHLLFNYLV
ncbi:MAG: PrsW family glutamic-type intramembrane protease [Candidatus Micrarchaeota archaeon]